MSWILYRAFWTPVTRRWLVRLAMRIDDDSRLHGWIVDRLYPDDATVSFPARGEE